jgi:uncharacterized protein involved in exopolysaccharide biosynthesis
VNAVYEQETRTDLKEYWAIVWRRKTLLILPIVIIPLVALAVSYVLPPTYSSTVSILLSEARILPPNVERQLESGTTYDRVSIRDKEKSLNDEITSTKYLKRLIAVLDIPIPQDIREIAVRMKAQYPEISENELAENILADRLRQRTTVDLQSNNLIEIGFSASDPVNAQKTAKALADIFIEESLAKELAGVRSNIAFSEEQLALYREKLTAAEDRLKEFRKELLVSAAEEDTSGQNLRQIASAIEALELEISLQESKLRDIRGRLISEGSAPDHNSDPDRSAYQAYMERPQGAESQRGSQNPAGPHERQNRLSCIRGVRRPESAHSIGHIGVPHWPTEYRIQQGQEVHPGSESG